MIAQKYRITWTQQTGMSAAVNRGLGQQMSNIDEMFETVFTELRRQAALIAAGGGGGTAQPNGYWTVLTNGDPVAPELIFADGAAIALFIPLP